MKKNNRLFLIIACLLAIGSFYLKWGMHHHPARAHFSREEIVNPAWKEVVKYAEENLPTKGQLKVNSDGFVYLKVDDAYIHTLFPMLDISQEGFKEPPYFRRSEAPGAHISVFYVNEHISPEEVGQFFHFTPKRIVIVQSSPKTSYAILQVDAPELEKLREKYGLSPKLFGHQYHISLGKKMHYLHKRFIPKRIQNLVFGKEKAPAIERSEVDEY